MERHALLSYTAQSVGDAGRLGKKALQKLVFLAQELGLARTDYEFRFYTYGPFSRDLAADIDLAEAAGELRVNFDQDRNFYLIRAGDRASESIERGGHLMSTNREKLDLLLKKVGCRTAKELELLATIKFVEPKRQELGPAEFVSYIRKLKPKYDDAEVRRHIQELDEVEAEFSDA
jgi:uncharacterized protein YwgA